MLASIIFCALIIIVVIYFDMKLAEGQSKYECLARTLVPA